MSCAASHTPRQLMVACLHACMHILPCTPAHFFPQCTLSHTEPSVGLCLHSNEHTCRATHAGPHTPEPVTLIDTKQLGYTGHGRTLCFLPGPHTHTLGRAMLTSSSAFLTSANAMSIPGRLDRVSLPAGKKF